MAAYESYAKSAISSAVYRVYEDGRIEAWTKDGRAQLPSTITADELVVAVTAGFLVLLGPNS